MALSGSKYRKNDQSSLLNCSGLLHWRVYKLRLFSRSDRRPPISVGTGEYICFMPRIICCTYLGISRSLAYKLAHEEGFPAIKIHNRYVIPQDRFIEWVEKQLKPDL